MTTLKLIVWLCYIGLDVACNFVMIEVNKSRPNYLIMNIVRGIAGMLYLSLVWKFQYELWYLNVFIFTVTSFWIIFDLWLNRIRRKHPFYIGSESGFIDRFGFKNPGIYYFGKVCALILMIFSLINIYQP